ncbi:hypothetical protein CONLIGDRAFT_262057 [Coniochaeta ligniaria NRRL 30616]|uniref:Histone deacetylase complex subunit SAP30 Sin3 binding domain-containing protein n=1 Tax=Coniochaeta ligniaria NRRL 30616 TaxID=1408157 RepID=A0A1J7IYI8_9PEZI|nr:hypothetical protein CONLIGDRAFT_262057 [Coniochaeta ligniaria NRRL 30616]
MAPSKTSRTAHDDDKPEGPGPIKEKARRANNHHSNGKLQRVASSTGSKLQELTSAAAAASATATVAAATAQDNATAPGLQWPAFDRDVLHSYRRAYRLDTPTAFTNDVRKWVLSKPGSIGLHSPSMARRKDFRRQSKDQLAGSVRKHFNGLGVQENDIIVDFLHKVRTQTVTKPPRTKRPEVTLAEQI